MIYFIIIIIIIIIIYNLTPPQQKNSHLTDDVITLDVTWEGGRFSH